MSGPKIQKRSMKAARSGKNKRDLAFVHCMLPGLWKYTLYMAEPVWQKISHQLLRRVGLIGITCAHCIKTFYFILVVLYKYFFMWGPTIFQYDEFTVLSGWLFLVHTAIFQYSTGRAQRSLDWERLLTPRVCLCVIYREYRFLRNRVVRRFRTTLQIHHITKHKTFTVVRPASLWSLAETLCWR